MVYQEKTLVFDRNYISKSTQLLQILFLHLEKGIAKERLLEELYGRDDVENRNGSLNNTIFRLRKQLEAAGLPEGKYFYLKKGIYYWDSVIPVETDFSVFEKKLEESRKETDEEKKTELLKQTCALYTGELLPNMTGENWAAVANIHYRDLYFEALEELCTILKEKRYYETIYQLTTTAAGMYPFSAGLPAPSMTMISYSAARWSKASCTFGISCFLKAKYSLAGIFPRTSPFTITWEPTSLVGFRRIGFM